MKKVLFILDNLEGGGAERVFVNNANGFVKNGIAVAFLLGKKQGTYLSMVHPSITVSEAGGTTFLHYLRSFPKFFRQHHFTHIFTASHYTVAAAVIAKKLTGVPARIFQTHHYSHPPSRELKYLKGDLVLRSIYFFISPLADKVIAVSKGSLQWLRTFSHRSLPNGSFIYNPVFDETIYSLAAEKFVFPVDVSGKTILLNIGRLAEQKDQFTLIKAFQLYLQQNQQTILFILGTGPLETQLDNYIKQQGLSEKVILAGFQQNPYKWIAGCDVFVLSSKYEGFGNVIVEAMALGKTVASTDCPDGPAEILENGHLGYLCPVENPVELASAISKAVKTPLDGEMLKRKSLQYTVDAIVQQYLAVL
jgi:glycosyltransferase involved in cell wall biosynthesis